MTECLKGEAIRDNITTCESAIPNNETWGMECTHECVKNLIRQICSLRLDLSIARQNNKKLVNAFEKFLPLCKDVVEASEAIKGESK